MDLKMMMAITAPMTITYIATGPSKNLIDKKIKAVAKL